MRARYMGWSVTAKVLFWLFVVLVVLPLVVAILVRVWPLDVEGGSSSGPPPSVLGGLVAPATAEAHYRRSDRRNLRRAVRHRRHGHRRHARRYAKRVKHWAHVPGNKFGGSRARQTHRRGCRWRSVEGRYEFNIPLVSDPDLFHAGLILRYCFRDGRVTRVDRYHSQGVTGFGRTTWWSYEGNVRHLGINRYEKWHGRKRGSFLARRVARFEQCIDVIGGCGFFFQIKRVWLKVRVFGDGTARTDWG